LASEQTTEVARPLRILVPLIAEQIKQGRDAGVEYFRKAGALLVEAREQVARAEWNRWVEKHFDIKAKTAHHWMHLANAAGTARARSIRTLSEFTHPSREPHHQPAFHEPVREALRAVDTDHYAQERQAKARERDLERALALKLIDIGFKVLATKLHPDKGGSREAMARLNRVRARLREIA
jgi:hypothetical protein